MKVKTLILALAVPLSIALVFAVSQVVSQPAGRGGEVEAQNLPPRTAGAADGERRTTKPRDTAASASVLKGGSPEIVLHALLSGTLARSTAAPAFRAMNRQADEGVRAYAARVEQQERLEEGLRVAHVNDKQREETLWAMYDLQLAMQSIPCLVLRFRTPANRGAHAEALPPFESFIRLTDERVRTTLESDQYDAFRAHFPKLEIPNRVFELQESHLRAVCGGRVPHVK